MRAQPTGRSVFSSSGSRPLVQVLSGATATRVQTRSVAPGPAPSPLRVAGKRVATGTLCQALRPSLYAVRAPGSAEESPVSQVPVTAPPISPSPRTTQAAAPAVRAGWRGRTGRSRVVVSTGVSAKEYRGGA